MNEFHRSALSDARGQPLLRGQEGIWFAQAMDPTGLSYILARYTEIHGPVDRAAFEAAARQVVTETETLRVYVEEREDGPVQHIAPLPDWSLPFLDVSAEPDPRNAALAWIDGQRRTPFDLSRPALFSWALIKLADDHFIWSQIVHHLILDGYGFHLIVQRLAAVYSALVNGNPVPPSNATSMAELVRDEVHYRSSADWAKDRDYWLTLLADRPDPVRLTQQPPPAYGPFRRRAIELPPEMVNALRNLARDSDASLADLLMAAVALYLYRLTGKRDILLSAPLLGRHDSMARQTPAMMSNIVPVRVRFHPADNIADLLSQVRRSRRAGARHQRFAREDLRQNLGLSPIDWDIAPVGVNNMPFNYRLSFGASPSTTHDPSNGPVPDLTFCSYYSAAGMGMLLHLDGHAALYEEAELRHHAERFQRLLASLATGSGDTPLSSVDLLDEAERRLVLGEFNATDHPLPPEPATLPALFEAQAAHTPEATALVFEDSELSYAALEGQANRLAWHLRSCGAGPEGIVALALERSPALVVAILAVLKTGAAYLPLDPEHPPARSAFMLDDSGARLLVSTSDVVERLAGEDATDDHTVILLDRPEVREALAALPTTPLSDTDRTRPLLPYNLAYLIYTSGSTGTPKGVTVAHTGVINLIHAQREAFAVAPEARVLQFAALAFDAVVSEVFATLGTGATLILASSDTLRDSTHLTNLFDQARVTHVTLPPVLLGSLDNQALRGITSLVVAGEACPPELVQRFAGGRRMVNGYGPTENTVGAAISAPLDPKQDGRGPVTDRRPDPEHAVVCSGRCPVAGAGGGCG